MPCSLKMMYRLRGIWRAEVSELDVSARIALAEVVHPVAQLPTSPRGFDGIGMRTLPTRLALRIDRHPVNHSLRGFLPEPRRLHLIAMPGVGLGDGNAFLDSVDRDDQRLWRHDASKVVARGG